MRCFIAIDLPAEIKEELLKIQESIPKDIAKFKLVEKENLHLTIRFLGEISDSEITKVKEALKLLSYKRFTASLSKIGVFPSFSYIKVVWVGLEPEKQIKELRDNTEKLLTQSGFPADERFEAHLTIARVKSIKDKAAFAKKVNDIQTKPLFFDINSIKLKKSTLTKQGPIYEDVFEVKLR